MGRMHVLVSLLSTSMVFAASTCAFAATDANAVSTADSTTTTETDSNDNDNDDSPQTVPGWFAETRKGDFQAGLDHAEKHSGATAAYMKSVVQKPREFGNLTQWFDANDYLGKRIRMTAWVKSELSSGTAQLWLRIDGEWKDAAKVGSFDNMNDRPIRGKTNWSRYSLVVDVPKNSRIVVFGLMLLGTGQVWLDDVSFEEVSTAVPLTGNSTGQKTKATNLDFEQNE